jgi:hypothetical protein
MAELTAAAIDMETSLTSEDDIGVKPANSGSDEVVVPSPGPVSVYTQVQGDDEEVEEYLVVGWNGAGSPVVVGSDGGLMLLSDDQLVRDVVW